MKFMVLQIDKSLILRVRQAITVPIESSTTWACIATPDQILGNLNI